MVLRDTVLPVKRGLLCWWGFAWLLACYPLMSHAQSTPASSDTSTVVIRQIQLIGNKKTKPFIIFRELPFQEGERISVTAVNDLLQKAHDQLMNTFLFIDVVPGVKNWKGGALDVVLQLKERWYIFPIPYLRIVDRNFNQWWVEEDHSLQRVDYGLHFSWYNLTGRNDKFTMVAENGYNRLFSLGYESPYLDKKLQQYLILGASYRNTRQVNFGTDSNKQVFFPDTTHLGDIFINRTVQGSIAYVFRKGVKQRHIVRLSYTWGLLADTINELTEAYGYAPYYQEGAQAIHFPELTYTYQYQNVDNIPYPLRGITANAQVDGKGLGLSKAVNIWTLTLKGGYYRPLTPGIYLALEGQVIAKSPAAQPYVNAHLMGFGDMFMQGLEYYIVDGSFGALLKETVRRQLFQWNMPTPFKHSQNYDHLPIRFFLKFYANQGYVYNDGPLYGSVLNNRLLYTEGLGLDIVTIYDLQLKFEFSWNQLGKNGLFLHNYKGF
jgi:hypothetical protein